ncbi:MAG: DEAD/DEAH box helicase [Pseudomonadota bacterium]
METFHQFDLPKESLQALAAMNFQKPTPVQVQTIPVALEGLDILGTAQTGTGKTGAFAIPLSAKILSHPGESVLVMAPTRELATQVMSVFHKLLSVDRSVKMALLIGGEAIERQIRQLGAKPRLIVGTPGRINDHLRRRTLRLNRTHSLVLDETDLMLDMGFDVQIDAIINKMPKDRQTMMFSATLPKQIEGMAGKYLKNPVRVSVGRESTPIKAIEQDVLVMSESDKYTELLKQLDQRQGSIIIFVRTKRGADKLSVKLNNKKRIAAAIHGDLRQSKRESALRDFRKQQYRIMVATDIAARGIDIPHIRHVINYDLPQCPKDYIHRIGRTARAGGTGSAISFVTKGEKRKWWAIEGLLDPSAKRDISKYPKAKGSKPNTRKHKKSKKIKKHKPANSKNLPSLTSKEVPNFVAKKFEKDRKFENSRKKAKPKSFFKKCGRKLKALLSA